MANRSITMKGNPLSLTGKELKVGDNAPDFSVVGTDLSEKHLADFKGKPMIICSVPSLDTSVCDIEMRRFNSEATRLPNAKVLVVSMDLPFAQGRWCGTEIKNVIALSDHRNASFGTSYGVLIQNLRLLARAVFVIDANGKIQYIQLVPELTHEPDYNAALSAVAKLR